MRQVKRVDPSSRIHTVPVEVSERRSKTCSVSHQRSSSSSDPAVARKASLSPTSAIDGWCLELTESYAEIKHKAPAEHLLTRSAVLLTGPHLVCSWRETLGGNVLLLLA